MSPPETGDCRAQGSLAFRGFGCRVRGCEFVGFTVQGLGSWGLESRVQSSVAFGALGG